MEQPIPLSVTVWGAFACFTRPEMKVERVTYPVMTPSAARGILESIFWKPEFHWQVREIWVLRPVRYFSILRNEVTKIINVQDMRRWAQNDGHFFADETEEPKNRAQRHTLALRDVAYCIFADIMLRPHATDDVAKYRDQFRRRVRAGQCFTRPYLGCREFAANFAEPDGSERPIPYSDDFGLMLLDLEYPAGGVVRGKSAAQPRFFPAHLDNGVLRVPARLAAERSA
ncbi:MAG: type I-C CRISPR-associated protein Cas5c [Thermomicrobiales bacterium]